MSSSGLSLSMSSALRTVLSRASNAIAASISGRGVAASNPALSLARQASSSSSSSSSPSGGVGPPRLTDSNQPAPPPADPRRHPWQGPAEERRGPLGTLTGSNEEIFGFVHLFMPKRSERRRGRIPKKSPGFGENAFQDKPVQKWEEYDGFGRYQYRHHRFPNNKTANDYQKRRVFAQHAEHRLRVNAIRKAADILPKEIRRLADLEVLKIPRDSSITRLNRRCVVTGRPRGIFHQFRMGRTIWRMQADYNKLSGVMRAKWMYGIHIKP